MNKTKYNIALYLYVMFLCFTSCKKSLYFEEDFLHNKNAYDEQSGMSEEFYLKIDSSQLIVHCTTSSMFWLEEFCMQDVFGEKGKNIAKYNHIELSSSIKILPADLDTVDYSGMFWGDIDGKAYVYGCHQNQLTILEIGLDPKDNQIIHSEPIDFDKFNEWNTYNLVINKDDHINLYFNDSLFYEDKDRKIDFYWDEFSDCFGISSGAHVKADKISIVLD